MPSYFNEILSVLELMASQLRGVWQPPREHLILVGAPSNMYNGFGREDADGTLRLNSMPISVSNADMAEFMSEALGNMTHDWYWANFIEPVPRLFSQNIASPAPGDIITILVYAPPYYYREMLDWQASPWNIARWQDSPWVQGHDPYDPFIRLLEQGVYHPPQPPTKPNPFAPSYNPAAPPFSVVMLYTDDEARINHEILMRGTNEWTAGQIGYPKRPTTANHWRDILHNLPRRILYGPTLSGAPLYPSVLIKLLLATHTDQILYYIATGIWEGKHWIHPLDVYDEEDAATLYKPAWQHPYEPLFDYVATLPTPGAARDWSALPSVNRERVRINRLDYFGHSGTNDAGVNELFFQYGWENTKGDPTGVGGEVSISTPDLIDTFQLSVAHPFTADATAHLWGCSLGETMGPALKDYIKTVIASDDFTDYDHLLDSESEMPRPIEGQAWQTFTNP